MEGKKVFGSCFYGKEVSPYGLQNSRVDYRALSQAFDMVLATGIMQKTYAIGEWEVVNGSEGYYYDSDTDIYYDFYDDVLMAGLDPDELSFNGNEYYQEYIISELGAEILKEWTNETVWYNDELDIYVWGVTHYGTSWDYVLTDIEIVK